MYLNRPGQDVVLLIIAVGSIPASWSKRIASSADHCCLLRELTWILQYDLFQGVISSSVNIVLILGMVSHACRSCCSWIQGNL